MTQRPRPPKQPIDIEAWSELYRNGASLTDLEILTGWHFATIRNRLAKAGVVIRSVGGVKGRPRRKIGPF
jgi:hypothetical protein